MSMVVFACVLRMLFNFWQTLLNFWNIELYSIRNKDVVRGGLCKHERIIFQSATMFAQKREGFRGAAEVFVACEQLETLRLDCLQVTSIQHTVSESGVLGGIAEALGTSRRRRGGPGLRIDPRGNLLRDAKPRSQTANTGARSPLAPRKAAARTARTSATRCAIALGLTLAVHLVLFVREIIIQIQLDPGRHGATRVTVLRLCDPGYFRVHRCSAQSS
ncbi:hypothetical protein C8R45DRAFT_938005 [Mycena sanguinolenta]|nr:hypothetical protein C8R45DRAFT_938005 [Mycena sanguinolenta]